MRLKLGMRRDRKMKMKMMEMGIQMEMEMEIGNRHGDEGGSEDGDEDEHEDGNAYREENGNNKVTKAPDSPRRSKETFGRKRHSNESDMTRTTNRRKSCQQPMCVMCGHFAFSEVCVTRGASPTPLEGASPFGHPFGQRASTCTECRPPTLQQPCIIKGPATLCEHTQIIWGHLRITNHKKTSNKGT